LLKVHRLLGFLWDAGECKGQSKCS
jgi:hypothetical protein